MSKKVVITLGKDGSVKAEAFGFKGSSCEEASAFLDDIFPKSKELVLKPSYYEEEEKETLIEKNGLPSGWCG